MEPSDRPERADRPTRGERPQQRGAGRGTESWATARLYVGAGRLAGIRPGDLVGAIANEAGVDSSAIGAIEIADRFSLVELPASLIDDVADALRGTTLRGKRVNVRRDRDTEGGGGGSRYGREPRRDFERRPREGGGESRGYGAYGDYGGGGDRRPGGRGAGRPSGPSGPSGRGGSPRGRGRYDR